MHKTGREGKRKQRIIIFLKKKMNYLSAAAIEMLTFGSKGAAGLGSNKEFPQKALQQLLIKRTDIGMPSIH